MRRGRSRAGRLLPVLLAYLTVLLIALIALAAGAPVARAADDVTSDGTLRIAVRDGRIADGGPLPDASVRVTARRDGSVLVVLGSATGADGVAVVSGLPRALSGSEVLLEVTARRSTTWRDDDGCTYEDALVGVAGGLIASLDGSVEVVAGPTSSAVCDLVWPDPSGPVPAPTQAAPSASSEPAAAAAPSATSGGHGPSVTPPPTDTHLAPPPRHPFRPGWGWVVLGLICFAVVLGLAWPDHRDHG